MLTTAGAFHSDHLAGAFTKPGLVTTHPAAPWDRLRGIRAARIANSLRRVRLPPSVLRSRNVICLVQLKVRWWSITSARHGAP